MTQYGIRGPDEWITDKGSVMLGKDQREFNNAGSAALGRLKLQGALTRSSDVYFYTAGDDFWQVWNNGDKERGLGLQTTARELGFGANTGIELDEADGTRPRSRVEAGGRERDVADRRRRSRRTARGIRPTTSSPRSVRATSPSRRCSSRTRTPRSRTAARCGSRTSSVDVTRPDTTTSLSDVRAEGDPAGRDRPERARRDARRVRRA